jgi:molecular chaperone IbpA
VRALDEARETRVHKERKPTHIALFEDMQMIDFTPLFRTAIGFDRLAHTLENAHRSDAGGYPPYNIELTGEHQYRITMAVAGFEQDELDIEVKDNILKVSGGRMPESGERTFLHRGIANRSFERSYQLADYVRVEGASLKNGLLHIDLVREIPEAMKPRRIEIQSDAAQPAIDSESAAA